MTDQSTVEQPTLLVVIYADPAKDGAAAEALRMAMGLGTGNRTLQLALMGPAAQILGEDVDELVDGEMMENHLDVFEDWGTPFYVSRSATACYDLSDSQVEVRPIDLPDLAGMMALAYQVMVFR